MRIRRAFIRVSGREVYAPRLAVHRRETESDKICEKYPKVSLPYYEDCQICFLRTFFAGGIISLSLEWRFVRRFGQSF